MKQNVWVFFLAFFSCLLLVGQAAAIDPIQIAPQDTAVDFTSRVTINHAEGNSFRTQTIPGADGIVRGIEVLSNVDQKEGYWAVFAISNPTDEQIDRLIVAPHYRLANSGLLHPDLGSMRIRSITPSEGFALDRQVSNDADVFQLTINPGAVITFVAELASPNLPRIYLWEPEAYKDAINSYTLYRGILLGIAGLLALLLTILFVVRGTTLFPATAMVAWAVLLYISIDFEFLGKILTVTTESEPIWRACAEVAFAASLFIFLFAYLNLNRWHYHFSLGAAMWVLVLCGLGAFAIYDPSTAAAAARISFALTTALGVCLIAYLSYRGYDRAIMLIPTWILIILWVIGAIACVTGRLDNDIVQPAFAGGLVLIVLLLSFTVMQHAFSGGVLQQGIFSDLERQALAVMGAGETVWDWDVPRDRLVITPDLSKYLGSAANAIDGSIRNWVNGMHADDRDRFRTILDSILDNRKGRIVQTFRLRSDDGHYHWFALRARPVIGADGEIIRCIGTVVDITDHKKAEERLLLDSIYDNLTGLPNRQLLLDRLQTYATLSSTDPNIRPTILMIDFEGFRRINEQFGMSIGDTFLLTIARRLSRLVKPQDMLSRVNADRFAIILATEKDPGKIAAFAEQIKRTVTAPIIFAEREIKLSVAIGLLTWTEGMSNAEDMLCDVELALIHAKERKGNNIELFRPNFRVLGLSRNEMENDIKRALQRHEIQLLYYPVLSLSDGSIVGFETRLEWHHPRQGIIAQKDLTNTIEKAKLTKAITHFAITQIIGAFHDLNEAYPKQEFFISLNLSSIDLISHDVINDIRNILTRNPVKNGRLICEVSEGVLTRNLNYSGDFLQQLKALGIRVALDKFGTGYSSLAYVVRFPFDIIKLDASLLSNHLVNKNTILASIINMAHNLGIKIIAEGVQNEDDVRFLREEKCEYIQSTLFSQPVSFPELVKVIEGNKSTES